MLKEFFTFNTSFAAFFILLLGSLVGSFLNVVILRWPKGESFVSPRSHCPDCKTEIPFYLNIPIVSWLWLRGKSKCCGKKISFIYPFVEALTAFLFLVSYLKFGWTFTCLEMCVFLTLAIPCFFIDLEHYLLPDILTFPGMGLALLGSFYAPNRSFLSSISGLILGGGFFWLLSWLYEKTRKKEGMGFGDVKLMAWLGALGGLGSLGFIIFSSSFLGAFVGIFVIVFFKGTKDTALPFGPFLILSALAYYFFSSTITQIFGAFII